MLECWALDPTERPTFTEISLKLAEVFGESSSLVITIFCFLLPVIYKGVFFTENEANNLGVDINHKDPEIEYLQNIPAEEAMHLSELETMGSQDKEDLFGAKKFDDSKLAAATELDKIEAAKVQENDSTEDDTSLEITGVCNK